VLRLLVCLAMSLSCSIRATDEGSFACPARKYAIDVPSTPPPITATLYSSKQGQVAVLIIYLSLQQWRTTVKIRQVIRIPYGAAGNSGEEEAL
jgi:hypothetical protein